MDYEVVASDLALQVSPSGDPMHDRVKCEQRFEEALRDERIGVASG